MKKTIFLSIMVQLSFAAVMLYIMQIQWMLKIIGRKVRLYLPGQKCFLPGSGRIL